MTEYEGIRFDLTDWRLIRFEQITCSKQIQMLQGSLRAMGIFYSPATFACPFTHVFYVRIPSQYFSVNPYSNPYLELTKSIARESKSS